MKILRDTQYLCILGSGFPWRSDSFEGSDSLEDPDLNFKDLIRESCKESELLDPTFWDLFQH